MGRGLPSGWESLPRTFISDPIPVEDALTDKDSCADKEVGPGLVEGCGEVGTEEEEGAGSDVCTVKRKDALFASKYLVLATTK